MIINSLLDSAWITMLQFYYFLTNNLINKFFFLYFNVKLRLIKTKPINNHNTQRIIHKT